MRALRVLGLIVVVTATGLLSGGAAGAGSTTSAILAVATGSPAAVAPAAPAAVPDLSPGGAQPVVGPAPVPQLLPAPAAIPAPAAVPAAPPKPKPKATMVAGTPCRSTASACVDLSANRAWLISGGTVQYGPVPITHGRKGFTTPPGTFRVSYKAADHVSSIYDAEMPYSVFFNGGIAFHQGSLKVLSHGCVHLSGKAAKTFFGSLGRGEVVQVVR